MKWPSSIRLIRHGESKYNALRAAKAADPDYQDFLASYHNRKEDPRTARTLAEALISHGGLMLGTSDYDTDITDRGRWQAEVTGEKLRERGTKPPDIIFVSPYKRTTETLAHLAIGWPELKSVRTVEDERVREQEHGLSLLYNDWRIYHVMHPEQERLYELEGPYWYRYAQGENVPDIRERWRSMTGTFTRDFSEQDVLIVTHHLSILAFRANMERLDHHGFTHLDRTQKPVNCGATDYLGDPTQGSDGHLSLHMYNEKLYD